MAFIEYNPNPRLLNTGDCVIRAICKALDMEWEKVYMDLTLKGLQLAMWGDTNAVWEAYLKERGFVQQVLPSTCPDCYTIADFAADHKDGTYIVATGTHVVAVKDGNYYDTGDSGKDVPSYYFYYEEEKAP